jgi:N-acetyl-anhydromuramyl-L-alanine amidase AmpD
MSNLKSCSNIVKYLMILVTLITTAAYSQQYKDDYSVFNTKRSERSATYYLILHTTEVGDESSLASVKRSGTCNYLVSTDGVIHRVISDNKVAKHAGRSMWNNHSNLSEYTIGIEIVGKHNLPITEKQIVAIKQLIDMLQVKYKLSDEKVLTHSMVAYGAPNKWHNFKHRGRKRCGMQFATSEVRQKLGLSNVFTKDPDVVAKRLKNADPYLAKVIYGGTYVPSKEEIAKVEEKTEDDEKFEGFQEVSAKGVYVIAGEEYDDATTIYFLPDGRIRTGKEIPQQELKTLPKGTKVLVGYVYGGKISLDRTAYSVVGKRWNSTSTFYRFPDGTIKNGDNVEEDKFCEGIIILFRQ